MTAAVGLRRRLWEQGVFTADDGTVPASAVPLETDGGLQPNNATWVLRE